MFMGDRSKSSTDLRERGGYRRSSKYHQPNRGAGGLIYRSYTIHDHDVIRAVGIRYRDHRAFTHDRRAQTPKSPEEFIPQHGPLGQTEDVEVRRERFADA